MTPLAPVDGVLTTPPMLTQVGIPTPAAAAPAATSFSDAMSAGIEEVESKLRTADDLVQRFTLDGSVPIHQVTYALEQARLSVELAMQIRGRLLDGYREIMNMQL
ncbi:flagellar hook-basal body complex protein FliE [Sphingomonas sp. DT-204]|uniref:flagellar hook-basal body complex protein FliE n=1 Tax=Sphingomonas sp. DT-204 TaxID=3396166 RepID=UPI003F1A18D6